MEDFRMKLREEIQRISNKIKNGDELTSEETKVLFLNSFLAEESNEQ